jgi:predicted deacylase
MMSLEQRHFKGASSGPKLLITGGVHGDEFEPMQAIRALITAFDMGTTPLLAGELTLVPCVNESAFMRGHRAAEDGLDLARVCPGSADRSITEQTAAALSKLIEESDFYIDLHTGGTEFSVQPMTGYTLHKNADVLANQRKMACAFDLPVVWGTAGNLDGRSLSVARDANVPAIYTEYLGGARCDEKGVTAYVTGCLNVMKWLKMIDSSADAHSSDSQVKLIVEDPRDGSGHMQVCNPSPIDGYFHPAVCLGDPIAVGDLLGSVCNLLGDQVYPITAEYSGRVHVLRTFPRVHKGESVGVILDTADEYRKTIEELR